MENFVCESLKIREKHMIEIMCYLDAYNFPGEWDFKQHAEHFSLCSLFLYAVGTKQLFFSALLHLITNQHLPSYLCTTPFFNSLSIVKIGAIKCAKRLEKLCCQI